MGEWRVEIDGWKSSPRDIISFFDSMIYNDMKAEANAWVARGQANLLVESDTAELFRNQGRVSCMIEFLTMLEYVKQDVVEAIEKDRKKEKA